MPALPPGGFLPTARGVLSNHELSRPSSARSSLRTSHVLHVKAPGWHRLQPLSRSLPPWPPALCAGAPCLQAAGLPALLKQVLPGACAGCVCTQVSAGLPVPLFLRLSVVLSQCPCLVTVLASRQVFVSSAVLTTISVTLYFINSCGPSPP